MAPKIKIIPPSLTHHYIQNAKKRYFDAYNSNVPLDVSRDQSREMLPKHQDDKFNAANSNRPSVNNIQRIGMRIYR